MGVVVPSPREGGMVGGMVDGPLFQERVVWCDGPLSKMMAWCDGPLSKMMVWFDGPLSKMVVWFNVSGCN